MNSRANSSVLCLFIILISILHPQEYTALSYQVVEQDTVMISVSSTIWSKPNENQSARLLYYKKSATDLGSKKEVLVARNTGERLFENTISWPTVGSQAFLVYELNETGKKELEAIYDVNGNLLSKIEFDSTSRVSGGGRKAYYYFDDGQYGGVDFYTGLFHIVNPERDVYKKIPVLDPPVPLDYEMGLTHQDGILYDPMHQDMFISISARSHYTIPEKRYAYVNLLLDKDGNVLWRRNKPRWTWAAMSPGGQYVTLFNEENGKDFEGPVEIIRRDGVTITTINTPFSVSRDKFSEDNKLIGFRDKHKKYRIYDVQTGELLNIFVFRGLHPIEDVAINNRLGILVVLRSDPSTLAGNRFVSVYPLDGSAKRPLWELDMGEFDRHSDNYASEAYVSISNNGKEITAYSNGHLRVFRLQE